MNNLIGYIATGVISLVVGVLLDRFKARSKVYYWSPHSFRFNLTKQNFSLQTDALTIQNIGREKATDIEIVADAEPDFYQLAPSLSYETQKLDNGHFIVKIKSLGPKEYFTIQILSYTKIPNLLNIKSSAGVASPMPFQIQRVFSRWFNVTVVGLMIIGIGTTIYWVVQLIQFLCKFYGII